MNGCLFTGMMSLLAAEILGVIKWQCIWWKGKLKTWWRKRWSSRYLPFPMPLHSSSLSTWQPPSCAQIHYIVSLKEMNDSPTAGFFGAQQSTATSPQQCQNILQPLNHW